MGTAMKTFGAALILTIVLLAVAAGAIWFRSGHILWESDGVSVIVGASEPDPVWDFSDHVFVIGYGSLAGLSALLLGLIYGLLAVVASYSRPPDPPET